MAAARVVSPEKANSGMLRRLERLDSDELEMEALGSGHQKMRCSEESGSLSPPPRFR